MSPDGDIFATGVTTSTSFTGTLNTAAQPNVTSLGTLTSLDISGGLGIAESLFHLDDTNTRIAFPLTIQLQQKQVVVRGFASTQLAIIFKYNDRR